VLASLPQDKAVAVLITMDPKEAARLAEAMDPLALAELLLQMEAEAAAAILQHMRPPKSASAMTSMLMYLCTPSNPQNMPKASRIVEAMALQRKAGMLRAMSMAHVAAVLTSFPPRSALQPLVLFEVEVAIGVMGNMCNTAVVDIVAVADTDVMRNLLSECPIRSAVKIVGFCPVQEQVRLVSALDTPRATELLQALDDDSAVALLMEMSEEHRKSILEHMYTTANGAMLVEYENLTGRLHEEGRMRRRHEKERKGPSVGNAQNVGIQ